METDDLNRDQLISIYQSIRSTMETNLDRRGMYISYFLSFLATVTGFIILGIIQIYGANNRLVLFLLIGPIINFAVCRLATKNNNAIYRSFLEHVTITAKLERLIGLTNTHGQCVMPERWLSVNKKHVHKKSRRRSIQPPELDENFSTNEFVESNLNKESNWHLNLIFLIIMVINVLLGIFILALGVKPDLLG